MKHAMMKIAKKTFWAVLAIVALIMSVAGYQYLTVAVAPEYDPEEHFDILHNNWEIN